MKIMGIDPGVNPAWGVIEVDAGEIKIVKYGKIKSDPELRMEDRMWEIHTKLMCVIAAHAPASIGVESVFCRHNTMGFILLTGAMIASILAAQHHGISVSTHMAPGVKRLICGHAKADKKEMQEAIKKRFSLKEVIRPHDCNDAVSVAIAHYEDMKNDNRK